MEQRGNTVDFVEAQIIRFVELMRPPIDIRAQLDIGYSYEKQVLILVEIRPKWDNPKEIMEIPFAKARYVKSRHIWNIYWMRASGKWDPYQPHAQANSLEEFFSVVDEDAYGCFKG
ncbi:MAG: DUF3024 domain-containing protein [Bacteroidota bacterium]